MNTENILIMPKRFNYGFNYEFNKAISEKINNDMVAVITLDCDNMEYIDSVGVGLLVMAQKKAQAAGKNIEMIRLNDSAKEVLVLSNLQKLIQFS